MSVGFGYITKMLSDGSSPTILADHGISTNHFYGDERRALNFIVTFFSSHQELPASRVIQAETNITFPELPDSPITYWRDKVQERFLFRSINTGTDRVRELLRAEDVEAASREVRDLSVSLQNVVSGFESSYMPDLIQQIMARHNLIRNAVGLIGIPFGFPFLDDMTGGMQGGDFIVVAARPKQGKCIGKGTPVIMYDGRIKKVEDVIVGDLLMGPDSMPRTVKSVVSGRQEMFKITPSNGDAFTCNKDHILSLKMSGSQSVIDISVRDYLNKSKRFKHHAKLWKPYKIFFGSQDVPYDPYAVGLYLAEGNTAQSAMYSLCGDDTVLHDYVHSYFSGLGYRVCERNVRSDRNCTCLNVSGTKGVKNAFRNYALNVLFKDGSRRIPDIYKYNSIDVRMQVLAGIIDGDGFLSNSGTGYDLISKYEEFIDDIIFLARSVGLRASTHGPCTKCIKSIGFSGTYYRCYISGDIHRVPCKVDRRKAVYSKRYRDPLKSGFSIESIGDGDYYGFGVDKDHRFLLGDFTVTHNSFLLLKSALEAWMIGKKILFVTMEMTSMQCAMRIVAMKASVPHHLIQKGQLSRFGEIAIEAEIARFAEGRDRFNMIEASLLGSVDDIVMQVQEYQPDVVYVDGAYMVQGGKGNQRWDRVMTAAEEMKKMALRNNIPVMASYQHNRKAESTKRGSASNSGDLGTIGYSDAPGQLASIALSINNDVDAVDTEFSLSSTMRKVLSVMAGREGAAGSAVIEFDFKRMTINQVEELDD